MIMADQAVILLAEDREDDILVIRRAFAKGDILNPLHVVRDGEEAIAYLAGEGKYANRSEYPLPELLLLDLSMPRVDGFQVLRWIRQQPGIASLRVVVLTSSDELPDINEAYRLGVNSFLVKPLDFQLFVETSKLIKDYWLRTDRAPETHRTKKKDRVPEPRENE